MVNGTFKCPDASYNGQAQGCFIQVKGQYHPRLRLHYHRTGSAVHFDLDVLGRTGLHDAAFRFGGAVQILRNRLLFRAHGTAIAIRMTTFFSAAYGG